MRVDFLLDEGEFGAHDAGMVPRIESIHKMDDSTRTIFFNGIETYIQNFDTKRAFATI